MDNAARQKPRWNLMKSVSYCANISFWNTDMLKTSVANRLSELSDLIMDVTHLSTHRVPGEV